MYGINRTENYPPNNSPPHTHSHHSPILPRECSHEEEGRKEEEEEEEEGRGGSEDLGRPALWPQVLGTSIAAMTQIDMGAVFAYPGITLPYLLHSQEEGLAFTPGQGALFASVVYLGAMVGSLLAGIPMVRFGQRITLLMALPLSFMCWILLYVAPNVWLILLTRFLQGLSLSMLANSSTTYVAEFSHSSVRGRLMAILDLSRQLGMLFAFILGTSNLSWREIGLTFAFTNTILPFIGSIFLPNSPRWLATQMRNREALRSLIFFRGKNYDSQDELRSILNQLNDSGKNVKVMKQLKMIREGSILRYVIIMAFVLFLIHFNGTSVIPAYIVIIMNEANITMSSFLAAVIVGVMRVVGTIFFTLIIDRINRKPLLTITSIISTVCLIVLGVYFYDQTYGRYLVTQRWLPILCLCVYAFFSASPVISLLRSELFPTSVRSTVVPILYTTFFIGAFSSLQAYTVIENTLGAYGAFWLFSACNILLVLIIIITVPETRGKTLEQITEIQRKISR